jgi:chromosome partitioning protein
MQIIAISNQKGGCGKTATTHALGDLLSKRRRVLLVDADPQGSLTGACGLTDGMVPNLATVLAGSPILQACYPLNDRLAILPATWSLVDTETELAGKPAYQNTLKRVLMRATGYDLVLIDTAPGLSVLTINALVASNGVIVPVMTDAQNIRALSLFLRTVQAVQTHWNIDLQIVGVLPTFYSAQLTHHNAALDEIRASGLPILQPIGRSVKVQESSAAGLPITQYDPEGTRAQEYQQLGREIDKWLLRNQ